jgi:5-methylcytosine-specific restriction endonuclease McrA
MMAKRRFSDAERYAVFTLHSERCYMCGEPLDLLTMEVDHVIPESFLEIPEKLKEVIDGYGLPNTFDLQSFENWLPSCTRCNGRKSDRVFNATTRIQLDLQIASEKATKARELAQQLVSKQVASRAWNTIKRAAAEETLDDSVLAAIKEFSDFHALNKMADIIETPTRLTPLLEILSEKDGLRVVRGPYGVGDGPMIFDERSNFRCPTCGNVAWNGARCVACGELSDE